MNYRKNFSAGLSSLYLAGTAAAHSAHESHSSGILSGVSADTWILSAVATGAAISVAGIYLSVKKHYRLKN
ncbi:hypothetical protein GKQ38_04310 [Candidatus Nanohaloarchaea archaeon]|nr:hypothetical protein GKQ38_04310 [Candidatus Nanohaloarchaea archaeon]